MDEVCLVPNSRFLILPDHSRAIVAMQAPFEIPVLADHLSRYAVSKDICRCSDTVLLPIEPPFFLPDNTGIFVLTDYDFI